MAVTASDVQTFAPELATVSTGIISTWIGWASGAVDPNVFGTDADQATMLWVCHNCVRAQSSGTAGPITDRKVGDVSASNASFAHLTDWNMLKTTAYGVALYALIQRYTAGGVVVL